MKNTTFIIDDETHKKIKLTCVELGISLGEFMRQAAEEKLKQCAQEQKNGGDNE